MKGVHFVYVLSPDFEPYLHCSLRSLLASETSIADVTVLSVGGELKHRFKQSLPVKTRVVDDIGNPSWMFNKVHICDVDHESVVFLDTDTLVLDSIDHIVRSSDADIAGRRATVMTLDSWSDKRWKRYQREHGASVNLPVLNGGFLIFRNGVHKRIKRNWLELMRSAYDHVIFGSERHVDQWSLSPALGYHGFSFQPLSREEHAFAWEQDEAIGATIYHTGTPNFFHHACRLRKHARLDIESPLPQPFLEWHRFLERLRRKARSLQGAWATGTMES